VWGELINNITQLTPDVIAILHHDFCLQLQFLLQFIIFVLVLLNDNVTGGFHNFLYLPYHLFAHSVS